MKTKFATIAALLALLFTACDDTTDTLGTSLTDNMDHLNIATDTFPVLTQSIVADSVLSRSVTGYLGKIRDPETTAYITGNFMTQFHTLDNYQLPAKDSIMSLDANNNIIADSCSIRLYYTDFYGDSLATMKITTHEMGEAMREGVNYYSNYDPKKAGLLRTNGINVKKAYTLTDLTESEDTRNDDSYTPNIKINLNQPYTDKDGKTYNNYGSYIMNKYYENPGYFKNSYNFIHNVCPGFYFETTDGIGSMAYVNISQLNLYFRYNQNDSTVVGTTSFAGTEEVLQATNVTNDKETISKLAADNTCTYIKAPAGIFTEMTLPVTSITNGHESDTLNTAKVVLPRINNSVHSKYDLDTPTSLLMIPKDSLYSFFENREIADNKTSFVATYTSAKNSYTFNNIADLITAMNNAKTSGIATDANWLAKHPDWNKVVLIPVTATYNTSGALVKVVHDMSLSSTRLVGGPDNPREPLTISVIYSRFGNQ